MLRLLASIACTTLGAEKGLPCYIPTCTCKASAVVRWSVKCWQIVCLCSKLIDVRVTCLVSCGVFRGNQVAVYNSTP